MGSVLAGAALGMAVGILNYRMLLILFRKIVESGGKNSGKLAVAGFLLHAAVYVGFVVLAVCIKQISVPGAAVGLIAGMGINFYLSQAAAKKSGKAAEPTEGGEDAGEKECIS